MAYEGTQAQKNTLLSEVVNNPRGVVVFTNYNSNPVAVATQKILDALNVADQNPTNSGATPDTVNIPNDEFDLVEALDEITRLEYSRLTGRDKCYVDAMMVAAFNAEAFGSTLKFGPVRKFFRKAFKDNSVHGDPSPNVTWKAVKDDRSRNASIGEALFGRGTVISAEDWTAARDTGVVS